MAYSPPKWTQLTTPSNATALESIKVAGDYFGNFADTLGGMRKSYDDGKEVRRKDDSDVNTAALRRKLEDASNLDSLEAMKSQISGAGLEQYEDRIDADVLSAAFDKEQGVMRGEAEQQYNEEFAARLNQAKTPEEFEAIRQSMSANPEYYNEAANIASLGAATDTAIQTQTDQNVTQQSIQWRGKTSKQINDEIALIKGTDAGATELIAAGNLAASAALTRETNDFSEKTTTKIRAAKTEDDYNLIAEEITAMQLSNPEMNLTNLINSNADLKQRVDLAAQKTTENDLALKLENLTDVDKLRELRANNKTTGALNWRELDQQYADQIKKATADNQSIKLATILKSAVTATPQSLIKKLDKVDTDVVGSEKIIEGYTRAIAQADTRLQKQFDKQVTEELEQAKDIGIVALTKAAKKLKASLPEDSRVDISGVEKMVSTLRTAALGSSVSTITTTKLEQQQETFDTNDKALQIAVRAVTDASQYVTTAKNGQIIFAVDTPQIIRDRVSLEARENGYVEPIRGLSDDKGAFNKDLIGRGFTPEQATALTNSIDQSLSISFDFNESTQQDYATGKAALNVKQATKLKSAEEVFKRVETDLFTATESIKNNVVGDFSEDISVWVNNNISTSNMFGFSSDFDNEEVNRITNTLLEEDITVTNSNGKEEVIKIPPEALKIIYSRTMDADGQVDITTASTENGAVDDIKKLVVQLMNRKNDALTRSVRALNQYNKAVQQIEVDHAASVSALATSLKVRDNVRQQSILPDSTLAGQRVLSNTLNRLTTTPPKPRVTANNANAQNANAQSTSNTPNSYISNLLKYLQNPVSPP